MTLSTLHKRYPYQKYRAPTCSCAMVFHVLSVAVMLLIPAIVAFYTRNFWVNELTYTEQPDVAFKYKMMALMGTDDGVKAWSTYSYFNTLSQDVLSVPSVSVQETDSNYDGKTDALNITLSWPVAVTSVQFLAVFQYSLGGVCELVMETPVFIQKTVSDQSVLVFGDLTLIQRSALQPHYPHTTYNTSLISKLNLLESYDLTKILNKVSGRDLATKITEHYSLSNPSSTFSLSVVLNIPTETIRYQPGFWEALKFAWIQYLALAFVTFHLIQRVRAFVFENMIVTTVNK